VLIASVLNFAVLIRPHPQILRYWTEEEHQRFLDAIDHYGHKDVKTIAAAVGTRNATQVCSMYQTLGVVCVLFVVICVNHRQMTHYNTHLSMVTKNCFYLECRMVYSRRSRYHVLLFVVFCFVAIKMVIHSNVCVGIYTCIRVCSCVSGNSRAIVEVK